MIHVLVISIFKNDYLINLINNLTDVNNHTSYNISLRDEKSENLLIRDISQLKRKKREI